MMPTPPPPPPSQSPAAAAAAAAAAAPLPPPPTPPRSNDFRSFEFDPATGICRRPSSFRYDGGCGCGVDDDDDGGDDDGSAVQYFVMRNVPGDGDCVFHAVLGAVFVSMGMIDPDAAYYSAGGVHSMALEMRKVVANFLSSPEGTLYVTNRPRKRIVRCRDLLSSAAKAEGMSIEEYLSRLRMPGRQGGLYGGGPELTVLSNILRRPISIFHLKQQSTTTTTTTTTTGGENDSCRELQRMGVFGEGIFEDSCKSIPDSVVSNAVFFTLDGRASAQQQQSSSSSTPSPIVSSPVKCSWHLHVLIADSGDNEKHACVLLPSVPILHNDR